MGIDHDDGASTYDDLFCGTVEAEEEQLPASTTLGDKGALVQSGGAGGGRTMEGYAPSSGGYYYHHCGLLLPKTPRNPDRGADFVADGTSDRNADGTSYRNADGNADGNATNIPMTGKPMQLGQTALPSNIPTTGKPTRTGMPTRTRKPTITRRPAITRRPTRRPTICTSLKSSKNSKGAKGLSHCLVAKGSVSGFSNPPPPLMFFVFEENKTRFRPILYSQLSK